MSGKCFLDTDILIYSFDEVHKAKRQKASRLIQESLQTQKGIISYQVVQEFINIAIKKLPGRFTQDELRDYSQIVLWPMCVVYPSPELFQSALSCHYQNKISFYDALIIIAASMSGCRVLYSEDLQHGQVISGVKVQNPFL